MTGHPEAVLARELALCYTSIAVVTDLDAGIEEGQGVTHAEVLEVFGSTITRLRGVLLDTIPRLPANDARPCAVRLGARRADPALRPAVSVR